MKKRRRIWINVPLFPLHDYVGQVYATKFAADGQAGVGETTVPAVIEYSVAPKKRCAGNKEGSRK